MQSTMQRCNAYLNAFTTYNKDLTGLTHYKSPAEHRTDADLLMTIGQLITDIDDLFNMGQPITPDQRAFYDECTDFFTNPIIIALINMN